MAFVVVASLLIFIASMVGRVTSKQAIVELEKKSLYDKTTVDIMKTYKLINDEEYKLMLLELKEEKDKF